MKKDVPQLLMSFKEGWLSWLYTAYTCGMVNPYNYMCQLPSVI